MDFVELEVAVAVVGEESVVVLAEVPDERVGCDPEDVSVDDP